MMAEEIPDEKFKSEVLRFIEIATQKFDGLTADVRTNSFHLDRLGAKLESVETKVERVDAGLADVKADIKDVSSNLKLLSGQFRDVGVMAIRDSQRINNLEERVGVLEADIH